MIEVLMPSEIWNHAVRALHRLRARAGVGCLLLETPDGVAVSAASRLFWRHPWFTSVSWSQAEGAWQALVTPGFVNGLDPTVPGVARSKEEPELDSELTAAPSIPLLSFAIPQRIPAFFQALNVGTGAEDEEVTEETRSLRSMDLYLAVARASYRSEIDIIDGSGTSGRAVDYSVTFDTDRLDQVGPRARLMRTSVFEPVREPTFVERLLGQHQDEGEDRLHLCTIYLLSQPGADAETPIDASWTPYVRHRVWWNLSHAARNKMPDNREYTPIRLFTGLAGGLGDFIANQILSGINDALDAVEGAVNNTTNAGKFWTS